MKLKLLSILLPAVLCILKGFAATEPDSSVSITSSKNEYNFVYSTQAGAVQVKQKLSNTYISNDYQVSYPVSEIYNSRISINNVTCKVDGHTPKGFEPKYTYYGEDDVFYSDAKVCYFPVLLPKKGSTATVTFDETLDDPRYFTSIYFADALAIKNMEVSIKIPRWMKVEIKELNFNNYHIQKSSVYITGEDADLVTYTIHDIPAMEQETNSPGPTYLYPHLLMLCKSATVAGSQITYFNTVADQYAWYHQLVKNTTNDEAVIKAKAAELTTGISNDLDKVKAIFYYVQNNIRYIAFEDGMAGFKPEKADEVLRKKYGDCKGMANLTKALLIAAGFDARLCWLGTNHIAYDYQTPSMAVDNHMICALLYKDKTYYLDATESYIGFNEYAERIQGRQVLMENGDKYILNKIPYGTETQNADNETAVLTIKGNSLIGKISRQWKGEDKEGVLAGINSVKHENTDESMKKFLSNNNSDYSITNLAISNTGIRDKDLTVSYDLEFKNAVNSFSKELYIEMDTKKDFADMTIKTDKRRYDYWFTYTTNTTTQTELDLPAGYKIVSLPPDLNIVNANYEFHISYIQQPGKLIYKKNITLKNTVLTTAMFPRWNSDIELLNKTYNQTITLKPVTE